MRVSWTALFVAASALALLVAFEAASWRDCRAAFGWAYCLQVLW